MQIRYLGAAFLITMGQMACTSGSNQNNSVSNGVIAVSVWKLVNFSALSQDEAVAIAGAIGINLAEVTPQNLQTALGNKGLFARSLGAGAGFQFALADAIPNTITMLWESDAAFATLNAQGQLTKKTNSNYLDIGATCAALGQQPTNNASVFALTMAGSLQVDDLPLYGDQTQDQIAWGLSSQPPNDPTCSSAISSMRYNSN